MWLLRPTHARCRILVLHKHRFYEAFIPIESIKKQLISIFQGIDKNAGDRE